MIFTRNLFSLFLLLSLNMISISISARPLPPPPVDFVYDETNTLSNDQRVSLSAELSHFQKSTGHQMVMAVLNSLKGEDFEGFVNEIFRKWKIGDKNIN